MSLAVNPDAQLWHHQPRHCNSPQGRLLTWYSSTSDMGVLRHMYRLGNHPLTEGEGEALRAEWGGTPD